MLERAGEAQTTSNILMVAPAQFRHNFDTAKDNSYQERPEGFTDQELDALTSLDRHSAFAQMEGLQGKVEALDAETHELASVEFANMVETLQGKMVRVIVIPDVREHDTPDSIFPNNPISLHAAEGGIAVKYPMKSDSRRAEKQLPIVETLTRDFGFRVAKVVDMSPLEESGDFVEGTGSMVLDRTNRIVYASFSQRTTPGGVEAFADFTGYKPVTFTSVDRIRKTPVYHTNVVMSVGNRFAVICTEAITDDTERTNVLNSLRETGKDIIEITTEQMNKFGGNILEVQDAQGCPLIVMSETARGIFTSAQLAQLEKYGEVVAVAIPTIEKHGGGSARCMMLEAHLPRNGENA